MQQISASQLNEWLKDSTAGARAKPQLLDVREPWELDVCRIADAKSMPMRSVPARYLGWTGMRKQ